MTFTVGLPFAGQDGIGLAFHQAGFVLRWHIEIVEFRRKVIALRNPRSYIGKDVHEEGKDTLQPVDVMAGGFPCTPVSGAGKRKGEADERWLWPEFARLVGELRPRVVFLENADEICAPIRDSAGNITAPAPGLRVIADLAALGYVSRWGIVSASNAGAPHERKRWWCVAYTDSFRRRRQSSVANYDSLHEQRQRENREIERTAEFYAAQSSDQGVAQCDTYEIGLARQATVEGITRTSQSQAIGANALRYTEPPRLQGQAEQILEVSTQSTERLGQQPIRQAHVSDLGRVVFDGLSRRLERSQRTQLYAAPLGLQPYPYEPDRLTDDTTDWQARVEAIGDSVCVPVVRAFAEGIYEWLTAQEA